jgi:uncharacterized phage protein (TIGR02218 family)
MSFLSREKAGGKPVELYVFQLGTDFLRYTDGRVALTVNGLAYQPAAIARSETTDSSEESQASVTITVPNALPVVAAMLSGPPTYRQTAVTIFRYQAGATDKAVIARGQVSSVRYHGASVEVTVTLAAAALSQLVPRKSYLPTCNHVVYDEFCQKIAADFTFGGVVASVLAQGAVGGSADGPSVTVTVATAPAEFGTAGYFTAGYFRISGTNEPRFIISHTVVSGVAHLVSMTALPATLIAGVVLDCTAGCDGSIGTCTTKFANLDNFFGFPYLPTKNPFTQGLN